MITRHSLAILAVIALAVLAFATCGRDTGAQTRACEVLVYWAVAPDRVVHLSQRPTAQPGAKWEWFLTVRGDWPVTGIPLYGDMMYLADVPGPTATFWPTSAPDAATRTPPAWVVTATPVATLTAAPTRAAWMPLVVRARVAP